MLDATIEKNSPTFDMDDVVFHMGEKEVEFARLTKKNRCQQKRIEELEHLVRQTKKEEEQKYSDSKISELEMSNTRLERKNKNLAQSLREERKKIESLTIERDKHRKELERRDKISAAHKKRKKKKTKTSNESKETNKSVEK